MLKIQSHTTSRVLKALSVFGGVQVITIICSVVRNKLVALWLGPAGMGLLAVFNNTIDMLSGTTQLNLRQSAIRDLAADPGARIVAVVRRLAFILGCLGTAVCLLLSPLLSWWSFDSLDHILPFVILSPVMLLSSMAQGEYAVMQGRDKLKALAKSTMYASLTASLLSVPLFYFLRFEGILPVILCFAVCNAAFAGLMRVRLPRVDMNLRQALREGRSMLSLGAYLTVSSAVTLLASYLFITYLTHFYGEAATGLYNTGYTLVNSYVGMIFMAIAMEYYPRLSSARGRRHHSELIVSHEMSTALWVLIPVISIFICGARLIVNILYSSAFEAVIPYISMAVIGVGLRASSWCMAYAILARGDGGLYIITEASSAVAYLGLNIPLYHYFGLDGLGAAYILWYGIYAGVCYLIFRRRYGMRLVHGVGALLWLCTGWGVAVYCLNALIGPLWAALISIPPAIYLSAKALLAKKG